jgi:hypothetical protein
LEHHWCPAAFAGVASGTIVSIPKTPHAIKISFRICKSSWFFSSVQFKTTFNIQPSFAAPAGTLAQSCDAVLGERHTEHRRVKRGSSD